MIITKNLRLLALAGGVMTSLAVATVANADTRIRIAGQHPPDHFATTVLNDVADKLRAADVGLDVKVFPAGQLGNGETVFDDVAKGAIDIGHTFVYSQNDPKLEMNSIPFLVTNYDEMRRVFSPGSRFFVNFEQLLAKQDVKLLGVFVEGFIGVATAKKPENPTTTGVKDVNIRVWSAEAARSAAVDMGFNTTTMGWGDVVPAIQQGTVDGVIGGTAESYYTIMRDAIKFYIPYNAFVENTAYYMSMKTWGALNEAQRDVIVSAFSTASEASMAKTQELDEEYSAKLAEAGVEVIAITDAERSAIAKTVRANTWALLEEKLGQDLLADLKSDLN